MNTTSRIVLAAASACTIAATPYARAVEVANGAILGNGISLSNGIGINGTLLSNGIQANGKTPQGFAANGIEEPQRPAVEMRAPEARTTTPARVESIRLPDGREVSVR